MKKVMCFGTFDILHKGHEFYLQEAKKLGGCLVVVVALDETVEKIKGALPTHNLEARVRALQQLKIADKVVLGRKGDKLKIVEEEKPDILCFGYDQKSFTENVKKELQKRGLSVEIVRLPAHHPGKYKSSIIKKGNSG